MIIYINKTDSLGDFLSSLPVLKGIYDRYGKIRLIIKKTNRKFKGIREFLEYQDIFTYVKFDDEILIINEPVHSMNIDPHNYCEKSNSKIRPGEVARFENAFKSIYKNLDFEVDDYFEIKFPQCNIATDKNMFIVGDRWDESSIDRRRATNMLQHLKNVIFLDYNNDLLTNCYIIKKSSLPFIGAFTGSSVLANLLAKDMFVVWKKEHWNSYFWRENDILWDGNKNIQQTFERHFYVNRQCKLLHEKDLYLILDNYNDREL